MTYEDIILELARTVREAERRARDHIASAQLGELFDGAGVVPCDVDGAGRFPASRPAPNRRTDRSLL